MTQCVTARTQRDQEVNMLHVISSVCDGLASILQQVFLQGTSPAWGACGLQALKWDPQCLPLTANLGSRWVLKLPSKTHNLNVKLEDTQYLWRTLLQGLLRHTASARIMQHAKRKVPRSSQMEFPSGRMSRTFSYYREISQFVSWYNDSLTKWQERGEEKQSASSLCSSA